MGKVKLFPFCIYKQKLNFHFFKNSFSNFKQVKRHENKTNWSFVSLQVFVSVFFQWGKEKSFWVYQPSEKSISVYLLGLAVKECMHLVVIFSPK